MSDDRLAKLQGAGFVFRCRAPRKLPGGSGGGGGGSGGGNDSMGGQPSPVGPHNGLNGGGSNQQQPSSHDMDGHDLSQHQPQQLLQHHMVNDSVVMEQSHHQYHV